MWILYLICGIVFGASVVLTYLHTARQHKLASEEADERGP